MLQALDKRSTQPRWALKRPRGAILGTAKLIERAMAHLLSCRKRRAAWDDLQWCLPSSIFMSHVSAVSSRHMSFPNYSVLHKLYLTVLAFICYHLVDHLASLVSL